MTFSELVTRTVSTPNKGSRNGAKITHIVLHHMATTGFEGVLESWRTGRKEGSANYAIDDDGEVVGVVDEALRSWSLSDAGWDSKSITFEVANEKVGDPWPVSKKAHDATARVVADVCKRYGIPINRDRILGHREVYTRHKASYPTACPGGLDMDWIVKRAAEINKPAPTPAAPEPTPIEETTQEDSMSPIIIVQPKGDSNATKYRVMPDGKLRKVGRIENDAYRGVQAKNPDMVFYIDVDPKRLAADLK